MRPTIALLHGLAIITLTLGTAPAARAQAPRRAVTLPPAESGLLVGFASGRSVWLELGDRAGAPIAAGPVRATASAAPFVVTGAAPLAKKQTRHGAIVRGTTRGAMVGTGVGLTAFVVSILFKDAEQNVDPTAGASWVASGVASGAIVGGLIARHRYDRQARAEQQVR